MSVGTLLMPFKFNIFSGNFDQTGSSSGGGGVIDSEVATYADLPETIGTPPVGAKVLVTSPSGFWPFRKPAGIYIRTNDTGTRDDDWTYAGILPEAFNDANFTVFNDTDPTKRLAFDASSIATGTTRTITMPDKDVTLGDGGGEVRSDFVTPYTYIGLANAGTSESTAAWLIRRSEFDADGSYISTTTANNVQWADRLTASYS